MRVLVVDCYAPDHADAHVTQLAIDRLRDRGNEIDYLSLNVEAFAGFMTAEERRAYESDQPVVSAAIQDSADRLLQADGLLLCYPTTMFGVPPRLKSWLERVMVPGVAFVFDDKRMLRPNLRTIRYLGAVTTTPHSFRSTLRARDLGRRTINRSLRAMCHRLCLPTYVRLQSGYSTARMARVINLRLGRWRSKA